MNTLITILIPLCAIVLITAVALQNPKGKVTNAPILLKNYNSRGANSITEKTTWFVAMAILVLSFISSFI